jgi:hypothetical protein
MRNKEDLFWYLFVLVIMSKRKVFYSEDQLNGAVVETKEEMSVNRASYDFRTRRTSCSHMKTGELRKELGRHTHLTPEQEEELCQMPIL